MSLALRSLNEFLARRRHLTAIGATVAVRVLLLAMSMATTVLIARQLGPAGRGEYAVAIAITGIGVQLANLGVHTSSSWAVARSPKLLGPLLANGLVLAVLLGLATAAMGWVVLGLVPTSVGLVTPMLLVALLSIPVGLVYLIGQNLMLGLQRIRVYNLVEIGNRSLVLVGVGLLAAVGTLTSLLAVTATALALAVAAVVTAFALYRWTTGAVRPRRRLVAEYGGYGLRVYASALFTFLALRLDFLLLGSIKDASAVGEYSIAVSIAEVVTLPAVVVGTIMFPRFSSMVDEAQRVRSTSRFTVLAASATIVAGAVTALVAEPVIDLLFGYQFQAAVEPLLWLLPGTVAFGVYSVLSHYYYSIGTPRLIVLAPFVGLLANVVLDVALIPAWGTSGAAIASTMAYGSMMVVTVVAFRVRRRRAMSGPTGDQGAGDAPA